MGIGPRVRPTGTRPVARVWAVASIAAVVGLTVLMMPGHVAHGWRAGHGSAAWREARENGAFAIQPGSRSPAGRLKVADAAPWAESAAPLTTTTPLPPIDPTPYGSPIVVGPPLATPPPADLAIGRHNAAAVVEVAHLAPVAGEGESVVGFTRDGSRLVTLSGDARLVVRDMPSGDVQRVGDIIDDGSYGHFVISPDGRILAVSNKWVLGNVDVWSLRDGSRARQHRGGEQIRGLRFSADGRHLVAAREWGAVQLWDVASGATLFHERRPRSEMAVIDAHPTLERWASADTGGQVHEHDYVSGEVLRTLYSSPDLPAISSLRYRPDRDDIVAVFDHGGAWDAYRHRVQLWRSGRMAEHFDFVGDRFIYDLAWDPTARRLAVWTDYGLRDAQATRVWLWDARASVPDRPSAEIRGKSPRGAAWTRDGELLLAGLDLTYITEDWPSGEVRAIDAATGQTVHVWEGVVHPHVSPDGSTLVVQGDGADDTHLRLYRVDPSLTVTPWPGATATPSPTATEAVTTTATETAPPRSTPSPSATTGTQRAICVPWAAAGAGERERGR